MRWVLLSDDWPPLSGGVASWSARVASGLARAGDRVDVFARHRTDLHVPKGVSVHGVSSRHFARTGAAALAWSARESLREADAVLATTWPVAWAVAPWLRRRRTPLHIVLHGSDWTRRGDEGLARWTLRRARVWAVSEHMATSARRKGLSVDWLPSPVDAAPEPRVPSTELKHLVMVARAVRLKGGDRFVRLVQSLGIRGTMVGGGPMQEAWAELGQGSVDFLGHCSRTRVEAVLRTADAAVLLPRTEADGTGAEGLGLSLLEAAAVGVPAIGCATGGVPEALGPGLCLTDPDDPAASAQAVRAWWSPRRGIEQREWLVRQHGISRCVAALRGSPSPTHRG